MSAAYQAWEPEFESPPTTETPGVAAHICDHGAGEA